MESAEEDFRAAFERLRLNAPMNVPKGTPLSQANVAREAGRDSSALKRARYPGLVSEIQRHIRELSEADVAATSSKTYSQARTEASKTAVARLRMERDQLASQLVEADRINFELRLELRRLESLVAGGVTVLARDRSKK